MTAATALAVGAALLVGCCCCGFGVWYRRRMRRAAAKEDAKRVVSTRGTGKAEMDVKVQRHSRLQRSRFSSLLHLSKPAPPPPPPPQPDATALPPGWQEHVDEKGAAFYHHEATGESAWERPRCEQQQELHVSRV